MKILRTARHIPKPFRLDPVMVFGSESYVTRFDSRFSFVPFVFEEEKVLDRELVTVIRQCKISLHNKPLMVISGIVISPFSMRESKTSFEYNGSSHLLIYHQKFCFDITKPFYNLICSTSSRGVFPAKCFPSFSEPTALMIVLSSCFRLHCFLSFSLSYTV